MSVIVERDYEEYTDLLPIQYNDSDNLREFLRIYLAKIQELNSSQLELSDINTDFKTATGYQLELIGKLVGAERKGRSDEEYRNEILFRISVNLGSGTPEDVINYLTIATNATKVRYWEHYPACTLLETNGDNLPSAIPSTLDNVTPAGVNTGGIAVLIENYAFRPVEIETAFDNVTNPEEDVDYPSLGKEGAELGNIELTSYIKEKVFTLIGKEFLLGQGILPELSEVYEIGNNLAGAENMLAGDETALATGLFRKNKEDVRGSLAELLTDRNQKQ